MTKPNQNKHIQTVLEKCKEDKDVLAVFLFGSRSREEHHEQSDIDICIALNAGKYAKKYLSQKKIEYLKIADLDISIFQQLPLYIRNRVIKEGKVLLNKNEDKLYELVFKTIQEYSDYEHIYRYYLKEVADTG